MASYCTISHVQAYTQLGAFGAGTVPTSTEVTQFMDQRAAELYLDLVDVMGSDAVGPGSPYTNNIDTSNDIGLALSLQLQMANAFGAAADALMAAVAGETPNRSARIEEMILSYESARKMLKAVAKIYLGVAALYGTHISSGEVSEASVVSKTEDGLTFDGETVF